MAGHRRALPAPVILTIVGLGAFVTALDQTVVVTALPSVMVDLKIPPYDLGRAAWISVYTAVFAPFGWIVARALAGQTDSRRRR